LRGEFASRAEVGFSAKLARAAQSANIRDILDYKALDRLLKQADKCFPSADNEEG
jgi:hypothetical protein